MLFHLLRKRDGQIALIKGARALPRQAVPRPIQVRNPERIAFFKQSGTVGEEAPPARFLTEQEPVPGNRQPLRQSRANRE